jgi:predicted lactoylglutathione lyase
MDKRISLVTLGCRDVPAARAFYEAIGWSDPKVYGDHTVFWQAGGMVLALWEREAMAESYGLADGPGFGGVALAYNVGSPEEVDVAIGDAERAGGRVTAAPEKQPWGGYSGAFTDPEGHAWEVAHNPGWQLRDDGTISLD